VTEASPSHHHATVPPWRDVRVLRFVSQVVIVAVVALIVGFLLLNAISAMNASGMSVSYDFLRATAGFEIAESPIPYDSSDSYGQAFVVGLLNTLFVSILGIVLATILGIIVGVARLSNNYLINRTASAYVELMRNTPLLVQLFILYFAVFLQLPPVAQSASLFDSIFLNQRGVVMPGPVATGPVGEWLLIFTVGFVVALVIRWFSIRRIEAAKPTYGLDWIAGVGVIALLVGSFFLLGRPAGVSNPVPGRFNFTGGLALSPEFSALLVGLVIYTAAFIAEVVRGGIQAVRRGQTEAALALGLTGAQTLRLIVFPQALRVIVPPLTSQYLNLAKNSSLAIAIGYPDLFKVSTTMMNQTGQPVPVILLVMATYLAISLVTSLLMNVYNRRVQVLER
jgi:general L-amino acid transport system permease protein